MRATRGPHKATQAIMEVVADRTVHGSTARFGARVLAAVEDSLGLDSALLAPAREVRPHSLHKESFLGLYAAYRTAPGRYAPTIAPLLRRAASLRGACIDTEVTSRRTRSRSAYYAEVVAPQRITHQIVGVLGMGGTRAATLWLCRHDRSQWRPRELEAVRGIIPLVSAAWVAIESIERGPAAVAEGGLDVLGARERDVAVFAARGMRTHEIALILGTSPHTVRNQLSRIFEKLGVSSRVELTARVLAVE